jgi:hypothetical protein
MLMPSTPFGISAGLYTDRVAPRRLACFRVVILGISVVQSDFCTGFDTRQLRYWSQIRGPSSSSGLPTIKIPSNIWRLGDQLRRSIIAGLHRGRCWDCRTNRRAPAAGAMSASSQKGRQFAAPAH